MSNMNTSVTNIGRFSTASGLNDPALRQFARGERPEAGKAAEAAAAAAQKKNPTGWETILLVEDDDAVRVVVRRVLEKHGYDVIEAANGVEALEVFASNLEPVHLVLSDVVMPRMSGRILLDRLMELPNRPRILMMSGYSDSEIERHGAFPQETPMIEKPFSIAAITTRIREILDRA
jgi:two-component system cell cycle sensor histidine kinase/response regulator CckA